MTGEDVLGGTGIPSADSGVDLRDGSWVGSDRAEEQSFTGSALESRSDDGDNASLLYAIDRGAGATVGGSYRFNERSSSPAAVPTTPAPGDVTPNPIIDVISGYDHPGYRNDDTAPFDVAALLRLLAND